jgi:hypothetical protein
VVAGRSSSSDEKYCEELLALGQKLFKAMRREDIDGLIPLLHEKMNLWPDSGMTKLTFVRKLRTREGEIYARLFNTKLYRVYEEKWRESRFSAAGRKSLPPIESVWSVKDQILKAKKVEVKVNFLSGETKDPPRLATLGFDWPGRPGLQELPNSTVFPTRHGWKVQVLFDDRAWGAYAPGIAPNKIKTEPACRRRIPDD